MPSFIKYFTNAGAGSPGRKAKGTDPRSELQKSVKPKVLHFVTGGGGKQTFSAAPYNWEQIDRAADTDSYVGQALLRYRELMWKEGYGLKSADPNALTYIKQRMRVLGLAQGQSFESLFKEIGENLVKYHNCFILKVRSADVGKMAGLNIKGLDGKDPVGGYFVIHPKTITIAEDMFGNVFAYRQTVQGGGAAPIDFKPEDIIHIRHARKSGTQWGVPFLDSAIEDIRSFRLLEEDMLTVSHSEIFPLLHYMVNGAKPEWTVDDSDIQKAYEELLMMKDNGAIVTKGADKIEILGAGGKSLDVTPYINHFKERAIVGLGLSPSQLGVSTGKGSDGDVDVKTYDKIKTYQDVIEDCINNDIFFELLIEGGFDPITAQRTGKADPGVLFEFKEIDVDAQIKRENHDSVLWLQNMLTHSEMRERLGMVVDPNHQDEYHIDMIELPLAEASKAVTGPEGGANPNSPAKGSAGSKNNPANQKGNRGGPKVKAWDDLASTVEAMAIDGDWDDIYSVINEFYRGRDASWLKHHDDLQFLIERAQVTGYEGVSIVPWIRGAFKTLKQSSLEMEAATLPTTITGTS